MTLEIILKAIEEVKQDPRFDLQSIDANQALFEELVNNCRELPYTFIKSEEMGEGEFVLNVFRKWSDHVYPKPLRMILYAEKIPNYRYYKHIEHRLPIALDRALCGFRYPVWLIGRFASELEYLSYRHRRRKSK